MENGWYCYKQIMGKNKIIALEIFRVREQKEQTVTLGGKEIHYPFAHKLPSNESFGAWAYSVALRPKNRLEASDESLLKVFRNFIKNKDA